MLEECPRAPIGNRARVGLLEHVEHDGLHLLRRDLDRGCAGGTLGVPAAPVGQLSEARAAVATASEASRRRDVVGVVDALIHTRASTALRSPASGRRARLLPRRGAGRQYPLAAGAPKEPAEHVRVAIPLQRGAAWLGREPSVGVAETPLSIRDDLDRPRRGVQHRDLFSLRGGQRTVGHDQTRAGRSTVRRGPTGSRSGRGSARPRGVTSSTHNAAPHSGGRRSMTSPVLESFGSFDANGEKYSTPVVRISSSGAPSTTLTRALWKRPSFPTRV